MEERRVEEEREGGGWRVESVTALYFLFARFEIDAKIPVDFVP